MPADPAADVVRDLFRRFRGEGNPFDLLHPDVQWEVPTIDQPGQHFEGHAGVADFFRRWVGTWDDYEVELEELIEAPDGRIVTLFIERARGKGSQVPVEIRPLGIYTVRDGKVIAYRGFTDRDEGLREAGLA